VFVAEGPKLVDEALRSDAPIEFVVLARDLLGERADKGLVANVSALEARGVPVYTIAESVMDSLQDARTPQPILAVVGRSESSGTPPLPSRPLVVVACGIQDPGNLGSMLRSSEAAGADLFVATSECASLYHPRAVRASAGSIFRLPTVACSIADLAALLDRIEMRWIGTMAADGTDYHAVNLTEGVALFFGAEGAGLPAAIVRRLDASVRIPMRSGVESLSVGAAAAVMLFEAARQRGSSVD
jgi:TrmH family RNA methyltransferase